MIAADKASHFLSPADELFAGWTFRDNSSRPLGTFDKTVWTDRNVIRIDRSADSPQSVLITFPGLASFEIGLDNRTIHISRLAADLRSNTLRHLLADQVLPRLVSNDGNLVIHAAGVSSPSGAILLVGLSGHGKSTLAASFHANGNALLGDDAMIVEAAARTAFCRPLYRSLRLFPDSIAAVFEGPRGQLPVADYTDKQNIIDLERADGINAHSPVRLIYCLATSGSDRIDVRRMGSAESCMALLNQSFALDPSDREQAELRLGQAAALASCVPVFEVSYPRDYGVLPKLRETLLSHQEPDR